MSIFKTILSAMFLLSITSQAQSSVIKAQAKEIIITPPLEIGYTLGGYGARMSKPAEGIHDNIRAKALILDNGTKHYAVITMDVLGFPPNVKPQIIEKLNMKGRWTEKNVLLLPSHTHTSLEMFALNDKNIFNMPPIGIFQPKLLEFVVDKLAGLIREADKNLMAVKIGTKCRQLEGLNRNRRGNPFVDRQLTVTRVDLQDGKPLAVLVNWTAHPTIMSDKDMYVSAGWPGYMQREIEACIGKGVVAMYYNGAEGDQSVIAKSAGSHYEQAEMYGRAIAVNVIKLYDSIVPSQDIEFAYNYEIIDLPDKKPHPQFMETGGKEYGLDEEKIQGLLNQVLPQKTSISALRLGDLLLAGAPGEMIAELGLHIKSVLKKDGIACPVIGGLANQWISYILSKNEYRKSGYEASVSFYGDALGDIIVKGMLETAKPLTK